ARSSTTPSCTRRWGSPPRPPRAEPSAKEALSFMGLRLTGPGACEVEVQFTREGVARNCQILADSEAPGRFGGGVRVTLGSGGQKKAPARGRGSKTPFGIQESITCTLSERTSPAYCRWVRPHRRAPQPCCWWPKHKPSQCCPALRLRELPQRRMG